jgi:hypothetical protein
LILIFQGVKSQINLQELDMALYRLNNLTSSISVLAITIGLVAAQSATQKSLAQFATSPATAPAISINGAGASTLNTLSRKAEGRRQEAEGNTGSCSLPRP